MAAYTAFKEPTLISDPLAGLIDSDFNDFDHRKLRYAIYWAFYENTAYRDVHKWAKAYRVQHGLYKYIRNVYNPAYALGEFWKSHLWGGDTDDALAIVSDNPALAETVAQIYTWSNWATRKDLVALYGSILGDVAIAVTDDTARKKVYLDVLHPGVIKSATLDGFGHVKAYEIEEERLDPRGGSRTVTYGERVTRDGELIVYQTSLDGRPYAWNGEADTWVEPYGFVPLVLIKHNDVGLDWGWSELHPSRSKIHEVDDLASKLSDQVRKMVDAPWLLGGVTKPTATPTTTRSANSAPRDPEPGREEVPTLYGPAGATATPLVAPLDIPATSEYIKSILDELQEREHPELQVKQLELAAGASGRAIRTARQSTEVKVRQRRANYDAALIRAQQMAVAIAGERGYLPGFGLDSYAAGVLDHTIAERPVFAKDPLDDIELKMEFWKMVQTATATGAPLPVVLARSGWSEEEIAAVVESDEYRSRQALAAMGIQGGG